MSPAAGIRRLLEKGLFHYGLGEVSKAIEIWHRVLQLDSANETALEYIEIETGRRPVPAEEAGEREEEILEPGREVHDKLPDAPALADEFLEGRRLIAFEDWGAAIKAFEAAHRFNPADTIYWAYVELARARMMKALIEKAGGLSAVLRLKVPLTELIGKKRFTQEEGFVLSLISGDISLQDVISLSPIPRFQTYKIIYNLLEDGLLKTGARKK